METLQSEASEQQTWAPHGAATARSAASGLGRWVLLGLFALGAPLALLIWTTMPRATSPSQLAESAVDLGITAVVRDAFIGELGIRLAERRNTPAAGEEMERIFDHALTQEWFDEQVTAIASELDRWFSSSRVAPPDLVVDLADVKLRLAADPLALVMVGEMLECTDCDDEATVGTVLQRVPDELRMGDESDTASEGMLQARDTLAIGRRIRDLIPVVLIVAAFVIGLLAARGTRVRWLGFVGLAAALPLAALAAVIPDVLAERAVDSLPAEFPIRAIHVEDLVDWMLQPARSLALILGAAGIGLVLASFVMAVAGRRRV